MKAIIVDDEESGRSALRNNLKAYCPDIEIIAEANSVATGVDVLGNHKPDIVFLDIEMPDGKGFDVLKQLESRAFSIIFVTAYDHYALDAFRFSAVDYLLKPIDPQHLIESIHKVKEQQSSGSDQIDLLLDMVQNKRPEKLALPSSKGITMVAIADIIHCESDNNYTTFFLTNGKKILVTRTIKEYDGLLAPHGFCRIHQSHLVNLGFIQEYVRGDGGYVILNNGYHIDVSRRKKDQLLAQLSLI